MSNIPEARRILSEICQSIRTDSYDPSEVASQIDEALSMMTREQMVRRAPDKSKPVTPEMKTRIRQLAKSQMHMSEIAHLLGINQGRVSEVLRGKR